MSRSLCPRTWSASRNRGTCSFNAGGIRISDGCDFSLSPCCAPAASGKAHRTASVTPLISGLYIGKNRRSEVLKSHNSPSKAMSLPASTDPRLEQLRDWLAGSLAGRTISLVPASADASFRRYFRVIAGKETWIAMDAPPAQEDCRPFVQVAGLLRSAGVNAPQVEAQDIARGFLLLTDFGDITYLAKLDGANADALFGDAIEALVKWQLSSRENVLPPY